MASVALRRALAAPAASPATAMPAGPAAALAAAADPVLVPAAAPEAAPALAAGAAAAEPAAVPGVAAGAAAAGAGGVPGRAPAPDDVPRVQGVGVVRAQHPLPGGQGAMLTDIIDGYQMAGAGHGDLMSILMRARDDETGTAMTSRQLRDEAATLVIAGSETTGNTVAWACYLIAQHPRIQERLQAEADLVLAGGDASYETLTRPMDHRLHQDRHAGILLPVRARHQELHRRGIQPGPSPCSCSARSPPAGTSGLPTAPPCTPASAAPWCRTNSPSS